MNTEILITRLKHRVEFPAKNQYKVFVNVITRVRMLPNGRGPVEKEITLIVIGPVNIEGRTFSHETKFIILAKADDMLPRVTDLNDYADSRLRGPRGQEEAAVTLFDAVQVGYILGQSKDDAQPFLLVNDPKYGTRKVMFEDAAALRGLVGEIHNAEII